MDKSGWRILYLVGVAGVLKFVLASQLEAEIDYRIKLVVVGVILVVGAGYILQGTANIIEETTEVLSEKTKLASGVLQSLGTAFPDMVLGLVAAVISLKLRNSNYALAINYAIVASATTFGSNIYNIGYSIWCVYRQNLANNLDKAVAMFPYLGRGGTLTPMKNHLKPPSTKEIEVSVEVLNMLSVLTSIVAVSMVLFGKVNSPFHTGEDLYQLVRPVGVVILAVCLLIVYRFRKNHRHSTPVGEVAREEKYYQGQPDVIVWLHLLVAGVAILFAAESMIHAVMVFCELTKLPFVVAGVVAGLVGCLGEMAVVYIYSVNPKGRLGDALVGVAMDNVVTIMGASLVAIMGGIFLGGSSLILIFVLILCLNTNLIWQISRLRGSFS